MEPPNVRRIRSAIIPRKRRWKTVNADTQWDTREGARKRRFNPRLWLPLLAGACLLAALGAYLFSTRPQNSAFVAQEVMPMPTTPVDHEKVQQETKLAVDCAATFFGSPHDIMKVAQCRPVPGLAKLYEDHKNEIARFARASPSPRGNVKRHPPFIGIPISFEGQPPRTVWVEIRGTAARLDLESFLGLGSVPWAELENAAAGAHVILCGNLVPLDDDDSRMDLISPDGESRIRINGPKPTELTTPRAARVTVARVAETTLVRKGWNLVSFDGWDWLTAKTEAAASQ